MDYYREYIETIDRLVNSFVNKHCIYLQAGEISVAKPVKNHLCLFLMLNGSREVYNESRIHGASQDEAAERIDELYLKRFQPTVGDFWLPTWRRDFESYRYLAESKGYNVVFCQNERQLNLWKPILSDLHTKILILCNFESDEDVMIDGDITLLDLCHIPQKSITNSYLERCFPSLYRYANLFIMLIEVLVPLRVLVMEGCHAETELLAAVCGCYSIETVCYQQGWPSVMHTRFREMGYNKFVTWGSGFTSLWQQYNPTISFIPGSYPYAVHRAVKEKTITFFLQSPIIIVDNEYFRQMLLLAQKMAAVCPDYNILIREHPEYRLSPQQLELFAGMSNVHLVTKLSLVDVFSKSLISVSAFSSTIIESLIHGTIPFIFDPSTDGHYYPSSERWALETKTPEDACDKLYELAVSQEKQQMYIACGLEYKKMFFS